MGPRTLCRRLALEFCTDTAVDFADVANWENNKLDRSESSRMGWSDVALCLAGPVVQDLRTHFAQRWNFIYDEKYSKKATRYSRLPETSSGAQQGGGNLPPSGQQRGLEDEQDSQRGFDRDNRDNDGERGLFGRQGGGDHHFRQKIMSRFDGGGHEEGQQYQHQTQSHVEHSSQRGGVDCQITRSSAKWSHNISTEVRQVGAHAEWG